MDCGTRLGNSLSKPPVPSYAQCMLAVEAASATARPTWRERLAALQPSPIVFGILCGAGAALFWAAGFVAARHGIAIGYSPADLAVHRFAWAGVFLLPMFLRTGSIADFGGAGWGRAVLLTLAGGPPLAIISYAGFLLVPLGHGGVIQPSCAALFGPLYASLVLGEPLPRERIIGAFVIVLGLCVIGLEALSTIGRHGLARRLRIRDGGAGALRPSRCWSSCGTSRRRGRQ